MSSVEYRQIFFNPNGIGELPVVTPFSCPPALFRAHGLGGKLVEPVKAGGCSPR